MGRVTPVPQQGARSGNYFRKTSPPLQEIDAVEPINSTFEFYEEIPDSAPLVISGSYVKVVVRRIRGAGGPGGADVKVLKY